MIATEQETRASQNWGPQALDELRRSRREFQDAHATQRDNWIRSNEYFYDSLKRVLQLIIEPGKRVLHVRCETGHLLAAVVPEYGIGVEIGQVMVDYAATQHPDLHFLKSDPEDLGLNEKFDYIIFDLPSVSDTGTTLAMASLMDKVLLVVESEGSDRDVVKRAYAELVGAEAKVSAVLNKSRSYGPKWLLGLN